MRVNAERIAESSAPWLGKPAILRPAGGRVLRRDASKALDTSCAAKMEGGGKNRAARCPVGAAHEPQGIFHFGICVVWRAP